MAHTFKYAILMAIPDPRRGERVNVGIVVFLDDRIDVRFAELGKIRALAGGDWATYANDVRANLLGRFSSSREAEASITSAPELDPIFQASELGWLSINSASEYEARIESILQNLVLRPKPKARPKSTRINTEIAAQLRNEKVLAKPADSIDNHLVVRNFCVSEEESLVADFALKNGVMHVAVTLDLRKSNVRLDEAALRAITLDKAKNVYQEQSRTLGVYAAPEGDRQFKSHIELLKEYSDEDYNWLIESERNKLLASLKRASAFPFKFGNA